MEGERWYGLGIRVLLGALATTVAILLTVYVEPAGHSAKDCGEGFVGLVFGGIAAGLGGVGLLITTMYPKMQKYFYAGSAVCLMTAVGCSYAGVYNSGCRIPVDNGDMRASIMVLASLHVAVTIVHTILANEAVLFGGGSVSGYMGGLVCLASVALAATALTLQQQGVRTVCSDDLNEDDFEGIVIFGLVSTFLLGVGYTLSDFYCNRDHYIEGDKKKVTENPFEVLARTKTWRTALLSGGGMGLTVVVYFLLNLLIIEPGSSDCGFVLRESDKKFGNAAVFTLLSAVAAQHLVPVFATEGSTEGKKIVGQMYESMQLL